MPEAAQGFRPITRSPQVSQSISRQILSALRAGDYPVGSRLPSEAALAQQFGVSRPSVREALAALQFAGYVESRRGAGCVVVSLDTTGTTVRRPVVELRHPADIVDLLGARLVLEPAVMAAAAADPDLAALARARSVIDGMRVAAAEPELRVSSDIEAHRALVQTCRNRVLVEATLQVLDVVLDPALAGSRSLAWSSPDRPHEWARHHSALLEAVAAGDAAAARRHSVAHLHSVGRLLLPGIDGDAALVRRLTRLIGES